MNLKRILKGIAVTMAAIWLLACTLLFSGQRLLLYPYPSPRPVENAVKIITVTTEDLRVEVPIAWYGNEQARVVWFHGNGEQLADTAYIVAPFIHRGIGVAAIEFAGYGLSSGEGPSEATILAGARAGMEAIGNQPICVGWSLGSGVAARMASEGRCSALVLLSPYTSIVKVAAQQYPIFPVSTLILDRFDTESFAKDLAIPTLIIHGRSDGLIPVEQGRQLAEQIPGAEYLEVEGGHLIGGDPQVLAQVAQWVMEKSKPVD